MKKLFIEYCNVIAYTITGIIFGFSFFLLFINFYHFKDVNSSYKKQESDFKVNEEIKIKLNNISSNINEFDVNKYQGNLNVYALSNIKSRLDTCVKKIDTDELNNLLNKKDVNVKDVYEMQQFYQINISNECLVKQIYELSLSSEYSKYNIDSLKTISPFINNNINELIKSTDYMQKVIKNNSSYQYTSNLNKMDLYDQVKDSYFELLNQYNLSLDFIYDISVWYKEAAK